MAVASSPPLAACFDGKGNVDVRDDHACGGRSYWKRVRADNQPGRFVPGDIVAHVSTGVPSREGYGHWYPVARDQVPEEVRRLLDAR